MARTPNPTDVIKIGQEAATLKANLPRKKWSQLVKLAHARGHTIGGEIQGGPDALKERTTASLRAEAQKSVADAYAPATKALSTREAAIGFLDEKRKTDDAAYRTWLTGETGKLNAQAQAADATLASQQSGIAEETKTAIAAARADSLARMAQNPGGVSDPTQSAALDTSAADTAATQHIQAARDQSAAITKIGVDSRTLASASLLAQQGARESSRQGDTLKALGDLNTDRSKMLSDQASAAVGKLDDLIKTNQSIVQANREADLAGASLGLKQDDSARAALEANRKYKLETAKFGLDKWKADNAATVEQAKLDLGYAGLASREGVAAAKRKLDEKLAKIRAGEKTKSKGVTTEERKLYDQVEKARKLLLRWDGNNAVPLAERDQRLRDMGAPQGVIDLSHALARNNNVMTPELRVQARKLGLTHSGYFWQPSATTTPYDNRNRG